jgi:hypothetical protein
MTAIVIALGMSWNLRYTDQAGMSAANLKD